ncbi:UNVERIFIED_CONTAM: hypothetical protein RMT77_001704 [Armadillidium vulgare]
MQKISMNFPAIVSFKIAFIALSTIIIIMLFNRVHQMNTFELKILERLKGPFKADDDEVLQVLKSNYLKEPSSNKYNLSNDHLYKLSKNYFSWPFIHRFTKLLFGKETGKFFIEAGALDGEFLSNTLWLEKDLNWTGLLIEPDPFNYGKLLTKNRKSWTSNSCISSSSYPKKVVFVSRNKRKDLITYNSWVYHGASHEYGYLPNNTDFDFYSASTLTYVSAQCFPLESYLLALNRTVIDYLSLDLQGSEIDIIKRFPFHRFIIRAMVVEHAFENYDKEFVNFITEKGFEFIACGGERDYVFINRSHFQNLNIKKENDCPIQKNI